MKFTENFNLNLPDLDDMADVEKLNENFRTIDTTMKSLETDPELAANVVDIKNKIGTEADADTQPTLFGRLAQLKNVLLEKLAEVLTKVTGIDGKIGNQDDEVGGIKTGSVMGKLNALFALLLGGIQVYEEAGTYEFTVPANVYELKISACGAGAGAGGACVSKHSEEGYPYQTRNGGGGGSGEAIKDKIYQVTPGQVITIKVGKKGIGGKGLVATQNNQKASDGTDGEATVIGNLVTLAGGHKGTGGPSDSDVRNSSCGLGGNKGGTGGNNGIRGTFQYFQNSNSTWYKYPQTNNGGNGGKTILGEKGKGGSCNTITNPKKNYETQAKDGTDGTDGYVSITWGVRG